MHRCRLLPARALDPPATIRTGRTTNRLSRPGIHEVQPRTERLDQITYVNDVNSNQFADTGILSSLKVKLPRCRIPSHTLLGHLDRLHLAPCLPPLVPRLVLLALHCLLLFLRFLLLRRNLTRMMLILAEIRRSRTTTRLQPSRNFAPLSSSSI